MEEKRSGPVSLSEVSQWAKEQRPQIVDAFN